MKKTELRIGNLVKVDNDLRPDLKGQVLAVYSIEDTAEGVNVGVGEPGKFRECGQFLKFVKPLKITDKWLELLGFTISGNRLSYLSIPELRSEIHYKKEPYGKCITLESSVGSFIPNDITHIHQVQNLYQAITGKELTLSEKP